MPEEITPPAPEPAAAPAAPVVEASKPEAPRKLEDLLGSLEEEARAAVLGEVSDARKEAQGLRTRLKEAEPKIAEYDKILDAQKTAEQKAVERAEAAEARVQTALTSVSQTKVEALADKLFTDTEDALVRLKDKIAGYVGDDGKVNEAAIQADLEAIIADRPHLKKDTAPAPVLPAIPAQGGSAGGAPSVDSQIAEAQKAGDHQTVIRLQNQKLHDPR